MSAEQQWPLTAAATQILVDTPSAEAKRGAKADPKASAKVAMKELILRGAFGVKVEETRRHNKKVTLLRGRAEQAPEPLRTFAGHLDRKAPGRIEEVIKTAARSSPKLLESLDASLRSELEGPKLVQ